MGSIDGVHPGGFGPCDPSVDRWDSTMHPAPSIELEGDESLSQAYPTRQAPAQWRVGDSNSLYGCDPFWRCLSPILPRVFYHLHILRPNESSIRPGKLPRPVGFEPTSSRTQMQGSHLLRSGPIRSPDLELPSLHEGIMVLARVAWELSPHPRQGRGRVPSRITPEVGA